MNTPKLLIVAMNAAHDALADDAEDFICCKCGFKMEYEEAIRCEACKQIFCDNCVLNDGHTGPEYCLACWREGEAIRATEATLQRPD